MSADDDDQDETIKLHGETLDAILEYVQKIDKYFEARNLGTDTRFIAGAILHAQIQTLEQWLTEVSEHLGFSKAAVLEAKKAAFRWHFDKYLQQSSETSPEISARADRRNIDQIPTTKEPPKILPNSN